MAEIEDPIGRLLQRCVLVFDVVDEAGFCGLQDGHPGNTACDLGPIAPLRDNALARFVISADERVLVRFAVQRDSIPQRDDKNLITRIPLYLEPQTG